MNFNDVPSSERLYIGIFGVRNSGKSSVINAITDQALAIVSDVKGTTTDPVYKSMELLPLGPVVIIDTPGLDDEGELGRQRVKKAYQVLNKTDVALIVVEADKGIGEIESLLIEKIQDKNIPYLVVANKIDSCEFASLPLDSVFISAEKHVGIEELKIRIADIAPRAVSNRKIIADIINPKDIVVLVVSIDESAPKERIILPQQQTLREIIDSGAIAVVARDHEVKELIASISPKPKLVVCDSQVFKKVEAEIPADIPLTSFSILFARYKGDLERLKRNIKVVSELQDGDKILMTEGCTHHRQCGDIGTFKIPRWLKEKTGKELVFETCSGSEFKEDLSEYKLIVHCGGCMLNEREMKYRIKCAEDQEVPILNYGILIAYLHGVLGRSLEVFNNN